MTRLAVRALLLLLVASLAGQALASSDQETLTGNFVWTATDGEETGNLKAVFTKAGDETWTVTFHFSWEGNPYAWEGTAEGSLTEGTLSGEVSASLNPPARYVFTGEFTDGTFRGTHTHVLQEGDSRETGTLTLGR